MDWRCLVCGRKFKDGEKPAACPECGVVSEFIIPDADYTRPSGRMSKISRASFKQAMDLEVEATRIYHEAAAKAKNEGDEITRIFFAGLARNEFGHQKAIKYQLACRPKKADSR